MNLALASVPTPDLATTGLELHTWSISPYSRKVKMALAYKGLSYVEHAAPLTARKEIQARTGKSQLPVLVDGERWITDSTDILAYLEEKWPSPSIYPADPADKLRCLLLEDWADETLTITGHWVVWNSKRNRQQLLGRIVQERPTSGSGLAKASYGTVFPIFLTIIAGMFGGPKGVTQQFHQQLAMLESLLTHSPYLFGQTPTAADFAVVGQLANCLYYPGGEALREHPRLTRLCEQLLATIA
jgi:glutathione S-transferase